jgi:hypothetical protein
MNELDENAHRVRRQAILDESRRLLAEPREEISALERIEARQRAAEREQAALEDVAAECADAYKSWTNGDVVRKALPTEPASTGPAVIATQEWVMDRLQQERELTNNSVAEALTEFIDQERLKIRGELLTEVQRLRAEAARERLDDIKQLKIQNANLQETLTKMRDEVSRKTVTLPMH